MEKRINVAELLKDCPSGMELDCTICDNVYFDEVTPYMIRCYIKNDTENNPIYFHKDGSYLTYNKSKCVIFPKGKTTWEGFQKSFKDGDIIFTHADCAKIGLGNTWISIFEENRNGGVATYVDYCNEGEDFYTYLEDKCLLCMKEDIIQQRLATEEEKAKLFKAIEDNGYKWNSETKTLEELSPNFRECSDNEPLDIPTMTTEFVKEHGLPCPNGYVFKDDNGNEILTSKIILEKIKKEYPKTFVEVLDFWYPDRQLEDDYQRSYKKDLIKKFQDLLYARDAYWKIAGEEMGLDRPWKPDWNEQTDKFTISNKCNEIYLNNTAWYAQLIIIPNSENERCFL